MATSLIENGIFLEPKTLKKNEKLDYFETRFSKIGFEGHGL